MDKSFKNHELFCFFNPKKKLTNKNWPPPYKNIRAVFFRRVDKHEQLIEILIIGLL